MEDYYISFLKCLFILSFQVPIVHEQIKGRLSSYPSTVLIETQMFLVTAEVILKKGLLDLVISKHV